MGAVEFSFAGELVVLLYAHGTFKILKRDISAHRQWMWRSYVLTLAAITLRVYIFFTSWHYDLTQPEAYATIAWSSWLPNLIVAEFCLRKNS